MRTVNTNLFLFIVLLFAFCALLKLNDHKQENQVVPIQVVYEKTQSKNEDKHILPVNYNINNDEIVVFNPNSRKYHRAYCEWAKKCKRCIRIPKQSAIQQGGIPCKVCGH